MCEACGPTVPPTPEERETRKRLLTQLKENNRRRGVNVNAIADPRCHGTPLKRFSLWLGDTLYNLKLVFGVMH